jgi:hypothetical protein
MPNLTRSIAAVAGVFFFATVALGLALRWEFVTGYLSMRGFNFVNLRHAHSHAGYYIVLTAPLFLALERLGRGFPRGLVYAYVAVAAAASAGFAWVGYNAVTIVLSALVLAVWLGAAWRLRGAGAGSWLPVAAVNLVAGACFIPPVGVLMGRDAELATRLAHVFLTILLLGVYLPLLWSLLGFERRRALWQWELLFLPAAGVMIFDAETGLAGRLVAALFGAMLYVELRRAPVTGRLRAYVLATAAVVTGGALLPQPMPYELRIAGIHFLVLGPAMHLVFAVFARRPVWLGYDAALAGMLGAIAAGPRLWPAEAMLVTAVASTVFVAAALPAVYALLSARTDYRKLKTEN